MKKVVLGFGIGLLCLLGLSGCGKESISKESTAKTTNSVTTSKSASNHQESTTSTTLSSSVETLKEDQPEVFWNSAKDQELQELMASWGKTMGQSYQAYRPAQNVDFYGLVLPDDVLVHSAKQPIAVDDQIVSAKWSDTGESSAEYSIVAVYSDAETASYLEKHVYFFGFHQGQPVVLVSMQNQGMPDGALHFKQTENQDLMTDFQKITGEIANQTADQMLQPTQNKTTWSSIDEAVEFYEAVYKNTDNPISQEIIWENYDRKCWSLVENSGNRMVLHWTNISGAGGSYDEFIKQGDTTELIVYDGNASYPNDPSTSYTIRNKDYQVIQTESLSNN